MGSEMCIRDRDYGLEPSRVIELSVLAKERFEGGCPSAPSWSLARLCEHVLGKTLPKDKTRMSNWEREELNESQIKYAAMDAWASLLVYRALMKRDVVESFGGERTSAIRCPNPSSRRTRKLKTSRRTRTRTKTRRTRSSTTKKTTKSRPMSSLTMLSIKASYPLKARARAK